MSKENVYLNTQRIGRVITIWNEVFCTLILSVGRLVTRNKCLSESSHRIAIHIDVVVEVLKAQSSISVDFCLDEEVI